MYAVRIVMIYVTKFHTDVFALPVDKSLAPGNEHYEDEGLLLAISNNSTLEDTWSWSQVSSDPLLGNFGIIRWLRIEGTIFISEHIK